MGLSLATGWKVRGSNLGGGEIFHTRPDRSWGPPSVLYNGYRVFPGDKAVGAWRWPPTPSSAKVKERVELYLFSPFGPSWPVLGWTYKWAWSLLGCDAASLGRRWPTLRGTNGLRNTLEWTYLPHTQRRNVASCRRSLFPYVAMYVIRFRPKLSSVPGHFWWTQWHSDRVFSDNIVPPSPRPYHSTNASQSSSFKLFFVRRTSGRSLGTFKEDSVAWNFEGGGGGWVEENFDIVF